MLGALMGHPTVDRNTMILKLAIDLSYERPTNVSLLAFAPRVAVS